MAIQRLDPGGQVIVTNTTTAVNAGFNDSNSFVGLSASAPAGRSDSNAYITSISGSFLGWFLSSNFNEAIMGFAFYNANTTFTNNIRLCSMADGGTNQCDVRTDASGHLFFTRNGTAIGGASTNLMNAVGWYYIEFRAKISSTVGVCEVRVKPPSGSMSVWLTATGVNNQATANAWVNRFFVISRGALTQYWKDIYILDTGTGINTTYLGDTTVGVLFPNAADGTFQQWAPNTGTQVAAVQDGILGTGTYPDGDTTYISDTVSGDISAFAHQSLSVGTIFGIVHGIYARTASTGTINQVLVQSGSVVETGPTITLGTTFKYYFDVLEQNPTGSVTWTSSTVNGTHPGVKIQATSASARVSQEFLMIAYPFGGGGSAGNNPSMLWIVT